MPYKEWLNSSHAARSSCQDCHLPPSGGSVRLSSVGPIRGQAPFGKHHLVGGNTFVLELMRQDRAAANTLQLVAGLDNFEATIARSSNLLSQATAKVGASACRDAETLKVEVSVTNLTGHKLPTGYPNRRVWLHLKAVDSTGATAFESGAVGADGEIVGLDVGFEPHYQVIQRGDQIQVYEAVMGDISNRTTLRLLHAARYLKDNRLLPQGMLRDASDTEIRPVGVATDTDFGSGEDRVIYEIATAGFRAPFSIEVELLYQAVSPRSVAGLAAYSSGEIDRFLALYRAADKSPRRIVGLTVTSQ
jgi:hypothetical protein